MKKLIDICSRLVVIVLLAFALVSMPNISFADDSITNIFCQMLELSSSLDDEMSYLLINSFQSDDTNALGSAFGIQIFNNNDNKCPFSSICIFFDTADESIIQISYTTRKGVKNYELLYSFLSDNYGEGVFEPEHKDEGITYLDKMVWKYNDASISIFRHGINNPKTYKNIENGTGNYVVEVVNPAGLPNINNGTNSTATVSTYESSILNTSNSTSDTTSYKLLRGEYIVGTHIPAGEYIVYPDDLGTIFVSSDAGLKVSELLDAANNDVIGRLVLSDGDIIEINGTSMTFVKR